MNLREACTTSVFTGIKKSMNRHTSSGVDCHAIISNNHVCCRMKYSLFRFVGGFFLPFFLDLNVHSVIFRAFSIPCSFSFLNCVSKKSLIFLCGLLHASISYCIA